MKIAVTGGMGSGKSTVSRVLAGELGAELVSSDELCRQELRPGQEGMMQFIGVFGDRFLITDGNLDRKRLREAVFTDNRIKKELEEILHPIVQRKIEDLYRRLHRVNKILVAEIPLLYETSMAIEYEVSVVVRVPREISILRVLNRDQLTEAEIVRVLDSQMPIELKARMADYVIDNSGTIASTIKQIGWLCRQLNKLVK